MELHSVLVRENVRTLRHPNHWKGLDGPDQEQLLHTMAEAQLEVHVLPGVAAQPAAMYIQVFRPYELGGVLLAVDGAMEVIPEGETLGWWRTAPHRLPRGSRHKWPARGPLSGRATWRRGT